MPGIGNEQSLLRANTEAMIARKSGDAPMKLVSRGAVEVEALLHHQMNSVPEVQLKPVQNADGTFEPMKGWDLPQDE